LRGRAGEAAEGVDHSLAGVLLVAIEAVAACSIDAGEDGKAAEISQTAIKLIEALGAQTLSAIVIEELSALIDDAAGADQASGTDCAARARSAAGRNRAACACHAARIAVTLGFVGAELIPRCFAAKRIETAHAHFYARFLAPAPIVRAATVARKCTAGPRTAHSAAADSDDDATCAHISAGSE
jgi:hypothetical protein